MWSSSNGYEPINSPPPPSPRRSRRPQFLAAIAVLTGILCLGSLWHVSDDLNISSLLTSPPATCNPYEQPGMLMYERDDPHANRWHPFGGIRDDVDREIENRETDDCTQPAPALAAAFVRASWNAVPPLNETVLKGEWAKAERAPDGRPWEDVEFARNRTVLYVGDSISRMTTKYFCDMVGEQLIEINWEHPWSPPEIFKDGTTSEEDEEGYDNEPLDPFGWHKMEPGKPASHIAHYCYVPGLDFLLIHLHTYGLDEEDFWSSKHTYIPPYSFEDRVQRLAAAYINRIRATTGRTSKAPELVYVNSGMWDVMRFAHQDIAADISLSTSLGPKRLATYRRRVRDVLTTVGKQFPDASLYWSASHYPIKPSNGWFFADVKTKTRPETKLLRLAELHGAAMSAFENTQDASPDEKKILDGVQLGRWGLAMIGQEDHQFDDLHPDLLPGGYLWADMALYDLRNEVRRRRL